MGDEKTYYKTFDFIFIIATSSIESNGVKNEKMKKSIEFFFPFYFADRFGCYVKLIGQIFVEMCVRCH